MSTKEEKYLPTSSQLMEASGNIIGLLAAVYIALKRASECTDLETMQIHIKAMIETMEEG